MPKEPILQKGMNVLGIDWNKHSTSGQEESAEKSGKTGEKIASTTKFAI
jgi:hypothetical protein